MSDERDPWRLPALQRFGSQLEDRPHRRRATIPAVVVAAAISGAVLLAAMGLRGGSAGARSIVNQAPAAAVRARTVSFRSLVHVADGTRTLRSFLQTGAIDFASGDYRTRVRPLDGATSTEWVSLNGTLYLSQAARTGGLRTPWVAVQLTPAERRALASAPESDALTDPLAMLRILRDTKAPATRTGTTLSAGVEAACYTLATTLAEVFEASTGHPAPGVFGGVRATFIVCLDALRRPLSVTEAVSGVGGARLTAQVAFSGYGAPARIAVPDGAAHDTRRVDTPQPLFGGPSRIFEGLLRRHGG